MDFLLSVSANISGARFLLPSMEIRHTFLLMCRCDNALQTSSIKITRNLLSIVLRLTSISRVFQLDFIFTYDLFSQILIQIISQYECHAFDGFSTTEERQHSTCPNMSVSRLWITIFTFSSLCFWEIACLGSGIQHTTRTSTPKDNNLGILFAVRHIKKYVYVVNIERKEI